MAGKKTETSVAPLIGDVVRSRTVTDRRDLHRRLRAVLGTANQRLAPPGELRITVGDEFQGDFGSVGQACAAALWLRLELLPDVDLRQGIGWGPVTLLERSPRVEDGPGWWAARAAIEAVKASQQSPGTRLARTAYSRGDGLDGPDPDLVNAALLCRDQLVGSLSARSVRLLRGLLAGVSQTELAQQEGISGSAVSQRVRGDGLAVIVTASKLLEGVR